MNTLTPKEYAKELMGKYKRMILCDLTIREAKLCALICVEALIIETSAEHELYKYERITRRDYYEVVKEEINKMK
jgi:hypothetical protein